jgi:hypothetical protein
MIFLSTANGLLGEHSGAGILDLPAGVVGVGRVVGGPGDGADLGGDRRLMAVDDAAVVEVEPQQDGSDDAGRTDRVEL